MGQSLVGCKIRGQALTLSLCLPGGVGRAGDHGDVSCPEAHTHAPAIVTRNYRQQGVSLARQESRPRLKSTKSAERALSCWLLLTSGH